MPGRYRIMIAIALIVAAVFFFWMMRNRIGATSVPAPSPSPTPTIEMSPSSLIPPSQPISTDEGDIVMCTMDAKQCPDGSFVGRQPPHCEFAPCPE